MPVSRFNKKLIDIARERGVVIKKAYSKTAEESYNANICPHCDAMFGDWFLPDYWYNKPIETIEIDINEINGFNNSYICYIKREWSKDFAKLKEEISKINEVDFEIDEQDRFFVIVPEKHIEAFVDILQESVKGGAWHDAVSADTIYVVFEDGIHKLNLNVEPENEIWQKMKELEPGVRDFANIKDMIKASQYGSYLHLS